MIVQKGSFKFNKVKVKSKTMKNELPRWIGITAKNWFTKGFRQGGGQTDASSSGWDARKKADVGKKRGILIGKGRGTLRHSIRVLQSTFSRIIIGSTGLPYARIHNEGLQGKAWGKHSFKMTKREFIGKSTKLETVIKARIKQKMNLIFR